MTTVAKTSGAVDSRGLGLVQNKDFRRDVQALRGLAVLMVVLYHAHVVLPGGFVGVDVFLVISGFVIGRLLVAGFASTDGVAFRLFYLRRIRRLLPALSLMLVTVVVLSPLLAPVGAKQSATRTGVAAALLSANAYLFRVTGAGYFNVDASLNPLLHTWSLSVEEQFYLIFPVLLFVAWKLGSRMGSPVVALKLFAVVLFTVSLALCVWLSFRGATQLRLAFFSPVTRGWEFAAGLALVLLMPFKSTRTRIFALVGGLVLIAYSALMFSDATVFPGVAAVAPVLGAALVIHSGTTLNAEERRFDAKRWLQPIIAVGDISYSWYLWHWPLIVFAGAFWPMAGRWPLVAAAVFSLVPAWFSYRLLEHRLRVSRNLRPARTLLLGVGCVIAPLLAFALSGVLDRLAAGQLGAQALIEARELHAGVNEGCHSAVPLGERTADSCTWESNVDGPRIVLFGDSNAGQFSEGFIDAVLSVGGKLQIITNSSCPTFDLLIRESRQSSGTACKRFIVETVKELKERPPDVIVVANSTDGYLSADTLEVAAPNLRSSVKGAAKAEAIEAGLERTLRALGESGARVVLIETVPKPGDRLRLETCSSLSAALNVNRCLPSPFPVSELGSRALANAVERSAATATGTEVWTFADKICPKGICKSNREGNLVWRDGSHISVATSQSLEPAIARLLKANG